MKQVYRVDEDGFFLEPVLLHEGEEVPNDCLEVEMPEGLYKAKFNGEAFVESLTQTEINAIKNSPLPPDQIELLKDTDAMTLMELMGVQMQVDEQTRLNADLTYQLVMKGVL